jgi:hypothetical protein
MSADVSAIVLAARGGTRLARALASVEWAAERIVADPADRVEGQALLPGVLRARDGVAAATRSWLLLLREDETVSDELAATIRDATGTAAYRLGQAVRAGGATFRLCGAPLRLARRAGTRLVAGGALGVELAVERGPVRRLPGHVVVHAVPSLATAVEDLDAESATRAALLRAAGVRPRLAHLVVAPLVPAARSLLARGSGGEPWTRWTLGVFAGFAAIATYAKLWELR